MKRMWIILSVVLILLSSFALAEEFTIQTYSTSFLTEPLDTTVCSCADDTVAFSITNLGSFPTAYTISSEQDVPLSTRAVVLEPQQQIRIAAQVPSECGVYGVTDALTFRVRDGFNQERRVTIAPERIDCLESSFALDAVSKTVSACMPINSTLYITNDGQITETYTIFTDPATTSLSASTVTVPPQTTGSIDATFRYACGTVGTEQLEYAIQTTNEGLTYEVAQDITFADNYSFTVDAGAAMRYCQEDGAQQSVRITNPQPFPNKFTLTTSGPITANDTEFWIGPNSSKELFLSSTAQEVGVVDYALTVDALYGETTVTYNDSVTVNNCFDVDLAGFTQTKYVCEQDSFAEDLSVINTGTEEVTVGLVLFGTDNVQLSETLVTIAQNSSVDVPLQFLVNATGREPVSIEAYREGELLAQKDFTLVSESLATCYGLDVPSRARVQYDEDDFTLAVQNDGTRYGTYSVTTNDPQNTIFGLDTQIALGRTEKTDVSFALVDVVEPGQIYNLTLTFTHEQSRAVFDHLVQVRITDDPWWQRASQSVQEFCQETDRCHMLSLGLLLLLLVGVVIILARNYGKRVYKFRLVVFLLAVGIALIAVLLVYVIQGVPQLYTEYNLSESTTTNLLLEEDMARTFNLSTFFFDPDDDIELFGVSDFDDAVLSYSLVDDQLTITPAPDWNGVTMIQLYAVDAEGAVAQSPSIRVDVLPVEDYSAWGYYDLFCSYVNVVLFWLLLVVVLTIVFYPKGEQAPEKKTYY